MQKLNLILFDNHKMECHHVSQNIWCFAIKFTCELSIFVVVKKCKSSLNGSMSHRSIMSHMSFA